jgi:phage portal protein BeeE
VGSFLSWLGGWRLDDAAASGPSLAQSSLALLGGSSDVAQVSDLPPAVAQAFGLHVERVDRAAAMRRPVIRRARAVICQTIGSQPLVAHRREPDGHVVDVTAERQLLRQPDPNTTLQHVLTWTVDDLLFYGVAWWRVLARDDRGFPTRAERLTRERLFLDAGRRQLHVDGEPVADRDVLRFDGPDEGLLAYGGDVLRTSQLLDEAVRKFATLDVPLGALKLAEGATELSTLPGSAGDGSDRSEVDALLDAWEDARRTRTTAYLNRAIDYQTYQLDAQRTQLAEGRQQQRIDEANLANVPPRLVNAPSASTMTYSNALAERADLVDTTLAGFVVAVEQRLSMPDVTPRGTAVRFDLSRYLHGDPLSALQAADVAVRLGALTPTEVRTDVLGRTPLPPPQEGQPQ